MKRSVVTLILSVAFLCLSASVSRADNPPEPVKLYEYVFKTPCGEEKVYSTFPLSEDAKAQIASDLLKECAEAIKDIKIDLKKSIF